jgi:hypothetical protein
MRILVILVVGIVGVGCGYSGSDGCSGEIVGEYCWHLGEDYDSCEDTCVDLGGRRIIKKYFAGSEGSQENCTLVAAAFGKPAAIAQDTSQDTAEYVYMGCMWAGAYDETYWLYGHMTNHTSKYGADHRFCSCVR